MSIQDIVKRAVLALGFEERTGLTAFDSSPKHNNGILPGAPNTPTWVAGKDGFGGALSFDGNDYVSILDADSLDMPANGKISFIAWVYITGTSTTEYIISKSLEYRIRVRGDDEFAHFDIYDGADWYYSYSEPGTFTRNAWHFFVCVANGTSITRIYVDGKELPLSHSGSYAIPPPTANIVLIGNVMTGTIDDVLILPYALTAAEVRALYESRSAFTATPNLRRGLVLDLDFQEGAGLKAFDRSWYANNGVVVNAPTWIAGGGITLNGTTQYIEVPDDETLTFGDGSDDSPFSIIVKINAVDVTDFCLVSKGIYNTDAEYVLLTDTDNKIRFAAYDESVDDCFIGRMFDTALAEGEDLIIAGVYDATEASSGFKILLNGRRVDDTDYDNNPGSYVAMENGLGHAVWAGRYSAEYADGSIKKLRVYNRVLSDYEVRVITEEWK